MPVDKKVYHRLKFLDNLLRSQDGVTYSQIQKSYKKKGYEVSIRTIQKDIELLEKEYQAELKESRSGHQIQLRYKDVTRSVLFPISTSALIEDVRTKLEDQSFFPHFLIAASILEHIAEGNPVQQFIDAVEFDYNTERTWIGYFSTLLRAIINRVCVSFKYQVSENESKEVTVSPYLLKQYNQRWYLVCKSESINHYLLDALDRIKGEVVVNSEAHFIEPDFNYLHECFYYTIGVSAALNDAIPVEDIVLRVSEKYFKYLDAKPFPDQESEQLDGYHLVRFRAKINRELMNRILSMGADAEVIAPEPLRDDVSMEINKMSASYQKMAK